MGILVLAVLLVWCVLGGLVCWAWVSGSTSMKEDVKFKVVEDDKPYREV